MTIFIILVPTVRGCTMLGLIICVVKEIFRCQEFPFWSEHQPFWKYLQNGPKYKTWPSLTVRSSINTTVQKESPLITLSGIQADINSVHLTDI